MRVFAYRIWQCTWGLPQTLVGLIVFLAHFRDEHFSFHGAVVTTWENKSSVSLGMFVFVAEDPNYIRRFQGRFSTGELFRRLLVHEYGHTIQSLLLGPFYLIIIGIPSFLWGFLPNLGKKRRTEQLSYFAFYTEKWANSLGEKVTGEKSMENLVID